VEVMKMLEWIMIILTGLLLFSTVVCGLWLRYSGKPVEPSSLDFHMIVGMLAAISTVITIVILMMRKG
jgi:hypothetical protein